MGFDTEKISTLPQEPGVYLMKNKEGEIIYVGKAKNIRSRVRSYFSTTSDMRFQTPYLLKELQEIETIITSNENEAFLLENILVKEHQPRFNIRLRDDKDYVSIRVDLSDPFPRLEVMRRRKRIKDNALYFGPYSSVKDVRETVRFIRKIFPLRNCKNSMFKTRTRPCLQYEIKRCPAPCVKSISQDEYTELINGAIMFLKGEDTELVKRLEKKMSEHSERLEFEKAGRIRDQVQTIKHSLTTTSVVFQKDYNRDAIALVQDELNTLVVILIYRSGNLISTRDFFFKHYFQSPEEILTSVITQFYDSNVDIPDEILIEREIEDRESIESWLTNRRGKKVAVLFPQRGDKHDIINFAIKNAQSRFEQRNQSKKDIESALIEIQKTLNLPQLPVQIEAFDISNIQGAFAVGSMVSFNNGEPEKSRYRRYKIKTVWGSNDFAMMKEVIDRRYRRALLEGRPLPDLLLVDGGKGQLEMALEVLRELNISTLPTVAIAKSHPDYSSNLSESLDNITYLDILREQSQNKDIGVALQSSKSKRQIKTIDRFFIPGRKNPIFFPAGSPALRLLMRIRDEAHRFAIEYHRKLMKSQRFQSVLEEIPGIGPKQRKRLLQTFGSLQGIKEASLENLISAGKISESTARKIYLFFHPEKETTGSPPR